MKSWAQRFALHLAAALGATGVLVAATSVGATQARQAAVVRTASGTATAIALAATATPTAAPTQAATATAVPTREATPTTAAATATSVPAPATATPAATSTATSVPAPSATPTPAAEPGRPPAHGRSEKDADEAETEGEDDGGGERRGPGGPETAERKPESERGNPAKPTTTQEAPGSRGQGNPASKPAPATPTPRPAPPPVPEAPRQRSVSGIVQAVGRDQVQVKATDGVRAVLLAPGAAIKLNGRSVGLGELRPGDQVVAVGRLEGQGQQTVLVASALTARR